MKKLFYICLMLLAVIINAGFYVQRNDEAKYNPPKPEDLHVHFLFSICNQTFCLNDIPVPTINFPSSFSL